MPVYKQQNSRNWLVEFVVENRRYRRSSGTTIKRTAEALERKWRQEVHEGRFLGREPKPMTLGEAADRYYETVIATRPTRKKSKEAEAYALARVKQDLGEDTLLSALETPVLAEWRDRLLKEKKAPATVNRYLAILRAILNRAYSDWGALSEVPQVRLLPFRNQRDRVVTEEEEIRILRHSAPHLRPLVIFLLDTGARLSEALDVTWADVGLPESGRGRVRLMRTKSGRLRHIPLTRRLSDLLSSLKPEESKPREPVFLYKAPGAVEAVPFRNPTRAWKSALMRAAVDCTLRLHDLRHTFASRLVSRGVPLYDVSKLLGHQSISMTQRYAHLSPTTFDAAIQQLEERT